MRDIEIDLIGDKPSKGKAVKAKPAKGKAVKAKPAKGKAIEAKSAKARGPSAKYPPTMKIKVVKLRDVRKGSAIGKVWDMVSSSKTIGDYIKKREKAGLSGLGGFLGFFVSSGNVQVNK